MLLSVNRYCPLPSSRILPNKFFPYSNLKKIAAPSVALPRNTAVGRTNEIAVGIKKPAILITALRRNIIDGLAFIFIPPNRLRRIAHRRILVLGNKALDPFGSFLRRNRAFIAFYKYKKKQNTWYNLKKIHIFFPFQIIAPRFCYMIICWSSPVFNNNNLQLKTWTVNTIYN